MAKDAGWKYSGDNKDYCHLCWERKVKGEL
jgi:hypothetical protein